MPATTARVTPAAFPSDVHATFDTPLVDRVAAAALALLPGVGPVRWRSLITCYDGDAARAALAHGVTQSAWTDALRDAARRLRAPDGATTVLLAGDRSYPRALLDLPDAPPLLWARGNLATLAVTPTAALVGTRHNSSAGAHTARRLVASLRGDNACVISGMARGIDGVVHDAALAAGLPTIAVLGTGVDVPYPAQHRALYARIVRDGAVVSEQPPGTSAVPGAFPRRNRIIAALADCTVVVEAGERSGALITADVALDLGRTVAAVPGPIDAQTSTGANALLRDGAHVLASVDDLLPLLRPPTIRRPAGERLERRPRAVRAATGSTAKSVPPALHGDELALWDALVEPAADADVAAEKAGLSARRCAAALAGLELHGAVATELTGAIRRL
ncbi:DNA processing protein DprA [Gemmatimonadetes bacterium T265]|nr:DNA processing protein DprA [Gemmatimonadetes bacterium T265]